MVDASNRAHCFMLYGLPVPFRGFYKEIIMSNTTNTAHIIAIALLGKTYAWHEFIDLALSCCTRSTNKDGKEVYEADGADKAKALVMLELQHIATGTNSRKGAGKTVSNMASLVQWAMNNDVSLYRANGAPVSMSSLDKARKEANATEAATEAATEVATETATETATEAATESTVRLLARIAELESVQVMMQAAIDAAYRAKNINEARKALIGCVSKS